MSVLNRNMIIARLAVHDDTKDWAKAINGGLSPQSFDFEINGNYGTLDRSRLIGTVIRSGNGIMFDVAMTKDELHAGNDGNSF